MSTTMRVSSGMVTVAVLPSAGFGDAVAAARRVIETRTHLDGAGALVDDREFEIAGDSGGRADADDEVGRTGVEREILAHLRRDVDDGARGR